MTNQTQSPSVQGNGLARAVLGLGICSVSWICVLVLSLVAFGACARCPDPGSLTPDPERLSSVLDQAEYLMLNCHLDSTYLDSAESLIGQVRSLDRNDERSLYLAARLKIEQADFALNKAGRRVLYRAAQVCAESLEHLDDSDARGHLWYGIATGRLGQMNGIINSLSMVPTLKREFNRALALDSTLPETYEALGRLNYELPAIAGGDLRRSVTYLQSGLRFAPNYTILRLDLARACVKLQRKEAARAELDTLLATSEPYPPCDFVRRDKPEAEKLLAQLKASD